ncbi:MAG TPA: endonuclease/exonuclease/phosphatase family protein [Candidatus Bathyarchaeia archaeon]|nr:endonuclease/exonuclease/phosphatase family protein [Candidatus Bathyarchaeia archaeon]
MRCFAVRPALRILLFFILAAHGSVLAVANAQESFPFAPAEGQLRIVGWNIEHLGDRDLAGSRPHRTPEQLDALAALMADFDAAVFALQEIKVKSVLEEVVQDMGPQYSAVYEESDNSFVYDETKVRLLEFETLRFLTEPPYSTYNTDYPNAVWPNLPFAPTARYLTTAVFETLDGRTLPFRVISCHNHWSSSLCRRYEGRAERLYVEELLQNQAEPPYIFLAGDYNESSAYASPHVDLLASEFIKKLPEQNGRTLEIDYIYATTSTLPLVPSGGMFFTRALDFGLSNTSFTNTYSDHRPTFVDFIPEPVPPPSAIARPQSGTGWREEGSSITLEVTAVWTMGSVQYQWLKDGDEIDGAQDRLLEITNLTIPDDAGEYVARVTDETPEKAVFFSNPVYVEVFPPGALYSATPLGLAFLAFLTILAGSFSLKRRLHR